MCDPGIKRLKKRRRSVTRCTRSYAATNRRNDRERRRSVTRCTRSKEQKKGRKVLQGAQATTLQHGPQVRKGRIPLQEPRWERQKTRAVRHPHRRAAKGLPVVRRVVIQRGPTLKSPPHEVGCIHQDKSRTHTPMPPGRCKTSEHIGDSRPLQVLMNKPQSTLHGGKTNGTKGGKRPEKGRPPPGWCHIQRAQVHPGARAQTSTHHKTGLQAATDHHTRPVGTTAAH